MKCQNCEENLEPTEENFECLDSGKSYHHDFGEYSWWSGVITCDNCGFKNDYEDQSI